jgi:hypothetical protein
MTHTAHCPRSPRKTLGAALLLGGLALAPAAHANAVVTNVGACADYFVMQAPSGSAVVQWAAGHTLAKGDVITGDLNGVGLVTAQMPQQGGAPVQVRVENFGMNYAAATQLLAMRCGVVVRPLGIP